MLDILDIDEATVVSEISMAQMQAEFEAMFNAPVTQMMAAREQQAQQAAQAQQVEQTPTPVFDRPPLRQGRSFIGGYDGTD